MFYGCHAVMLSSSWCAFVATQRAQRTKNSTAVCRLKKFSNDDDGKETEPEARATVGKTSAIEDICALRIETSTEVIGCTRSVGVR